MNKFELLQETAREDGIDIIDYNFNSENIKALYCDGTVALNSNIETSVEKACILAEELGHHFTSSGNIVFLETQSDRKQERIARGWAYDKMIGLLEIVSAFERRCMNSYEMAEYLGVTEEFLKDALEYYKQKYGTGAKYGQYWISFTPSLMVAKIY